MVSFFVLFNTSDVSIDVKMEKNSFVASFGNYLTVTKTNENIERYTGPYEVTPKTEAQTLETKDKLMSDNVNVRSIPYFETGNVSGGNTVYIGSEV